MLADATEQLERAVLEAASWMEARGGALARDTHELLQTRTRQSAAGALARRHYTILDYYYYY